MTRFPCQIPNDITLADDNNFIIITQQANAGITYLKTSFSLLGFFYLWNCKFKMWVVNQQIQEVSKWVADMDIQLA
jgi:hypothetical protein